MEERDAKLREELKNRDMTSEMKQKRMQNLYVKC